MDAATTKGIYLLVTLDPEGSIQIATKPGNAWDSTWSPPAEMNRK
jgi:hypothetical protein